MSADVRGRPGRAARIFFPLAAVFAATAVPVWILGLAASPAARAWPSASLWHGHEMVFGYALAVVAGYLVTRVSAPMLGALVAAWLAGRGAALMAPSASTAALALAFPSALAVLAAAPFLRAVKRARNAAFVVVLAGLAAAELLTQAGRLDLAADGGGGGILVGLDAIVALLFLMGGRVIAAATSGVIQRQGGHLDDVGQAGLERLGVMVLATMTLSDAASTPALAAAGAGAAAMVALARLGRWRVWRTVGVAEVAVLHLGYAWLAAGLGVRAVAEVAGWPAGPDALHGLAVGALGTLTLAMMERATRQRTGQPLVLGSALGWALALVNAAALARLTAAIGAMRAPMIAAAAVLWSAAFIIAVVELVRLVRAPGGGERHFPNP